jgi:putative NIF3 family GTP cyclohydrolase 1 type 2
MNARELYKKLDSDFITPGMSDEWVQYMDDITDYLCDNFKKREMGLVCDFSQEITRVYTAVFPSQKVMQKILDDGVEDALLFTHHPSIWDIRKAPEVFYQMDRDLLEKFKKRRISVYTLHVPLDAHGEYSTSNCLANALDIDIEKPFLPYQGVLAGVIGKTKLRTVDEFKKVFQSAVGHDVKLYQYGDKEIKNGRVAVVAGGGNDVNTVQEVLDEDINLIVTGISAKNDHSQKVHDREKEKGINVLGGTHYSTEKFACIAMCDYFRDLGLPTKFVSDTPIFEDL